MTGCGLKILCHQKWKVPLGPLSLLLFVVIVALLFSSCVVATKSKFKLNLLELGSPLLVSYHLSTSALSFELPSCGACFGENFSLCVLVGKNFWGTFPPLLLRYRLEVHSPSNCLVVVHVLERIFGCACLLGRIPGAASFTGFSCFFVLVWLAIFVWNLDHFC